LQTGENQKETSLNWLQTQWSRIKWWATDVCTKAIMLFCQLPGLLSFTDVVPKVFIHYWICWPLTNI
jgi:hypothetical protein